MLRGMSWSCNCSRFPSYISPESGAIVLVGGSSEVWWRRRGGTKAVPLCDPSSYPSTCASSRLWLLLQPGRWRWFWAMCVHGPALICLETCGLSATAACRPSFLLSLQRPSVTPSLPEQGASPTPNADKVVQVRAGVWA